MEIATTNGRPIIIDEADYILLRDLRFHVFNRRGQPHYVATHINGKIRRVTELLRGTVDGDIDHKNGDIFDNRRSNLRVCTHAENSRNRKIHSNNKSGYKGVYLDKSLRGTKTWIANITIDGKRIKIRKSTAIEAAEAYNQLALKHHGEFARLNQL